MPQILISSDLNRRQFIGGNSFYSEILMHLPKINFLRFICFYILAKYILNPMNKKLSFLIIAIAATTACLAQVKKKNPVKKASMPVAGTVIKSSSDSLDYAFGMSIAQDLKKKGITGLNYSLLNKAMMDVFQDKKASLTPEQNQKVIYTYMSAMNARKYEGVIAEGSKFLEENKNKEGVVSLPSGLQYIVLTPAEGAKPKATDEVTVHYKGTLLNGKQFDSSYDRGTPASFALNQVIPGWTEGVQQMTAGSKYRFFIPYQLAYGANGSGKSIPPYSTLIFEVELIKIGK